MRLRRKPLQRAGSPQVCAKQSLPQEESARASERATAAMAASTLERQSAAAFRASSAAERDAAVERCAAIIIRAVADARACDVARLSLGGALIAARNMHYHIVVGGLSPVV